MRSKWKGPFVDQLILKKKRLYLKEKTNNPWRSKIKLKFTLRSRRSTILHFLENSFVKIYSGNRHLLMNIKYDQIGHKFGDFALTKHRCIHKKKEKKKKTKK